MKIMQSPGTIRVWLKQDGPRQQGLNLLPFCSIKRDSSWPPLFIFFFSLNHPCFSLRAFLYLLFFLLNTCYCCNTILYKWHHNDELNIINSMQSQTYITEFKEEHVDQAAAVLTRSFLQLNTIWKHHQPKYEEIYPIMRGKIIPALASGWSFVLMRGQKVIGVSIEYELLDYLQMPSMPSQLQLFKKLGEAGEKLQAKVDFSNTKRGDSIYGLYGVIDPSEANKGHSLQFWWYSFAMGKIGGWKYYYSRISSPVSLKMLVKLGAEVLAEADCENQKLWMIRIDLTKPWPSFSMLKQLTKINAKKKSEPNPKL